MTNPDPLVLKRAFPILEKVRDLSLRRGDGGLRDLCRVFRKSRIGPEEFKSEMAAFGVTLTPKENEAVFQAFRDDIGYLLVGKFTDAVVNAFPVAPVAISAIKEAFASLGPRPLPAAVSKKVDTVTVFGVPRSAICDTSVAEFHPRVIAGVSKVDEARKDFEDTFSSRYYSEDGLVPENEFYAYYVAVLFAVSSNITSEECANAIRMQWRLNDDYGDANDTRGKVEHASMPNMISDELMSTMVSVALPYKSKYVEVRENIDKPHRVVGYQGHLPTAQERYGETFHRVDASVGPFRRPDADDDDTELAVDKSHAFIRQGNKANHHNFQFA